MKIGGSRKGDGNLISAEKPPDEECYFQEYLRFGLGKGSVGILAHAQTGHATLIRHVRVFDGESVVSNTSVLVRNAR